MKEGRIVKALSGFYYVKSEDNVYACKGRGVFRKKNVSPLVGDIVTFQVTNSTEGYITSIHPRRNEFVRPPIANVTQAVIVIAATEPDFSPLLLDRFLALVESKNIHPYIVMTKRDLVRPEEMDALIEYEQDYKNLGYDVSFLALQEGAHLDAIVNFFKGEVTVLIGQSGVGKSTLLNCINPELNIKTGEISKSLGRGRHTTRHVELISINDGLVADTPGFSSLELSEIEASELSNCFIEMRKMRNECKFRQCLHQNEPQCAVKRAVEAGNISSYRYDHYLQFLQEILDRKPRY